MPVKRAGRWLGPLFIGAIAIATVAAFPSCATPTAIRVSVYSEVPCATGADVVFTLAGSSSALGDAAPAAVARECTDLPDGTSQRGSVVVTPQRDTSEPIAFSVATRNDSQPADACGVGGPGCVVARRELRFVAGRTLDVRVDLRLGCLGVKCGDGETCVKGLCEPDQVSASCGGSCAEEGLTPVDASCPASARPKISSFVDAFSGTTLAPNWFTAAPPCIVEKGGALVATPPPNAPSAAYCIADTVATYDLTCDSVFVKIAQATAATFGAQTSFYVSAPSDLYSVIFVLNAGKLLLGSGPSGALTTTLDLGPYDPQDLWWRARARGNELHFDGAHDGKAWHEVGHIVAPFPLDNVRIRLGAGTFKPVGAPGQAQFRCYNVPPPCQ